VEGSARRDGSLRAHAWYGAPLLPARPGGVSRPLAQALVGAAVAALLFATGHRLGAGVVLSVAVVLGAVGAASPGARAALERAWAALGRWLGRAVSWGLLAPLFLLVFPLIRGWMRLLGKDPLRLRERHAASYWLEADDDGRKVAHAGAMFATEPSRGRGRIYVVILAVAVGLVAAAEALPHLLRFGPSILYVPSARAGYLPAPHQRLSRSGVRVETNAWGMRAPDYPAAKPAGTFRILMIGDSTLYGGSYVDQEDLYARRLERALRAAAGRPVEVLNLGVNAWGPFHELGWAREHGALDSDLVVVCLPIGDIYRPLYGLSATPLMSANAPPRLFLEEMVAHLAWRLRELQIGRPSADEVAWQGRAGIRAYAELAALLGAGGAEVMFQVLPTRSVAFAARPEEAGADLREVDALRAALDPAIRMSYASGVFRGQGTAGELFFDAWHLRTKGHAVYAGFLEREIRDHSRAWAAAPAGGGKP
jgi:hypothetical protein